MGSSNQNETRKEHRLRDMPPLGPMQKKSRVSEKTVGLEYFSTNLGFVLVHVGMIFIRTSHLLSIVIH